jgi:peroxiredoxin Q/BCP
MKRIGTGDRAPNFSLPSSSGDSVSLDAYLGKSVVLYFYPKDGSPACTAQACAFRDAYEAFLGAGAEVIGISADSTTSHQNFAAKHSLPFTLLSDAKGEVQRRYGVPKTLGVLPGRVTYVIDPQGVVRHVFNSQLGMARHVSEALDILKTLRPRPTKEVAS